MKLNKFEEALKDAEKTIELNPKFVKGYSRKGAAYLCMKRYSEAYESYSAGNIILILIFFFFSYCTVNFFYCTVNLFFLFFFCFCRFTD